MILKTHNFIKVNFIEKISVDKCISSARHHLAMLITETNSDITYDYIKTVIDNLRHPLEYITSDVVSHFPKAKQLHQNIYFPYKKRENIIKFFHTHTTIRNFNDVQDYSFNFKIRYLNTMIGIDNFIKHVDRLKNDSYGLLSIRKNIPFFPFMVFLVFLLQIAQQLGIIEFKIQ